MVRGVPGGAPGQSFDVVTRGNGLVARQGTAAASTIRVQYVHRQDPGSDAGYQRQQPFHGFSPHQLPCIASIRIAAITLRKRAV
jgi:hypothetical protein